jgi:hypothetical protein
MFLKGLSPDMTVDHLWQLFKEGSMIRFNVGDPTQAFLDFKSREKLAEAILAAQRRGMEAEIGLRSRVPVFHRDIKPVWKLVQVDLPK